MKRKYFTTENLPENILTRVEKELKLGYLNLADECFEQAEMNFKYVLALDERCSDAWWGLMLTKFQISNEDQLFAEPVKFKSVLLLPECQKALEFANEAQKNIYADLLERINQINEGDNY